MAFPLSLAFAFPLSLANELSLQVGTLALALALALEQPTVVAARVTTSSRVHVRVSIGVELLRRRRGIPFCWRVPQLVDGALDDGREVVRVQVRDVRQLAAGALQVLGEQGARWSQRHAPLVRNVEQGVVPVQQLLSPRDLLRGGPAVEQVEVPAAGRAGPQHHALEPSPAHVLDVGEDQLLVRGRAQGGWLEVLDTIQVGQVDGAGVGVPCIVAVLVHVHAEDGNVDAVDPLEHHDDLRHVGDGGRERSGSGPACAAVIAALCGTIGVVSMAAVSTSTAGTSLRSSSSRL